jgi:hypothetical protein
MRIEGIECLVRFSKSKICDPASPKRSSGQSSHVRAIQEFGTLGKVGMFWIEDGEII